MSKITHIVNGDELVSLAEIGKTMSNFPLNFMSLSTLSNENQINDQIKAQEFKMENLKSEIENEKDKIINKYNQRIATLLEKVIKL